MAVSLDKVPHEVVTTDSHAWHSRGITGITVWPTVGYARAHLARLLAKPYYQAGGRGAFMRRAV